MPQVFPSNSLLQKPPPLPSCSLLPWDTSCSNAPLASDLKNILILLTLHPSPSCSLQQTARPASNDIQAPVICKEKARSETIPCEGWTVARQNISRMQWYFTLLQAELLVVWDEFDFYSLISFFILRLFLPLKWKEHLTKQACEKALWFVDGSELLRWSKCAFSTQQPGHTHLALSICKHIRGVLGRECLARLSTQSAVGQEMNSVSLVAADRGRQSLHKSISMSFKGRQWMDWSLVTRLCLSLGLQGTKQDLSWSYPLRYTIIIKYTNAKLCPSSLLWIFVTL